MTHKIEFRIDKFRLMIVFTPRMGLCLLAMALVAAIAVEVGSETLTMTTTYPSPAGIYRTIVTTGNTTLARDIPGTKVTVGSPTNASALNVIGSASVSGNLGVGGGANITGKSYITSSDSTYGVLSLGSSSSEASLGFTNNDGYTWVIGIGSWGYPNNAFVIGNGNYGVYCNLPSSGAGWSCSSDGRFKENVRPLENVLQKLKGIRGVSYNLKGQRPEKRDIGLIAQEVEKEFPELVTVSKTTVGKKGHEKQINDFRSLDYSQFTAVLLEAVKGQQAEIETLQAQLKSVLNK